MSVWRSPLTPWVVSAAIAGFLGTSSMAWAQPSLRITGSDADGVKITCTEAALRRSFRVVAMNAEKVASAEVLITPLLDDAGKEVREVSARWIGSGEITLDAPRAFEVFASLPRAGVYTADIDLVYAGKRTTTRLTVTRTVAELKAPGVAVLGSRSARVEKWPGMGSVEISIALRDTEGADQILEAPSLSFLELRGTGSDRFQKVGGTLSWVRGDLALSPNHDGTIVVSVGGLDQAGVYEGSARFGAPGRKPLDVPFTVTVKESRWLAAILIAVGVLGSYGLRLYLGTFRKRLAVRRDILRVARDLDARAAGSADERDRSVLRALQRRLDELREDLDLDVDVDVSAALAVVSRKLPLLDAWREARARAAKLDPEAIRALLPKLDAVAETISRVAATPEQVESAAKILDEIDLRSAERDDLTKALQAFEREIDAVKGGSAPEIRRRADGEIAPLLRQVKLLRDRDALDEARGRLDHARLLHARLLVDEMRARLAGAMPRGFDDDTWAGLRARLAPLLDEAGAAETADAAALAYGSAVAEYLAAVRIALGHDCEVLDKALAASDAPDKDAVAERIKRVRARIEEPVASTRETAAVQVAAAAELTALEQVIFPRMAEHFAGAEPSAWSPGVVPAMIGASGARKTEASATPESVTARIRSYDGAVTACLLLVAVVTGLKLLWAGNDTWGGFESWLVAVLWGLGLHQVGSAPFEGILGLREKLAKLG